MVCPDLIKENKTHSASICSNSYDEVIRKSFRECYKEQCPCYVLCGEKEYCTKYSKELMQ